ncbi:hypothetical protein SSP35_15_00810 [Streptomyces sp. NBRC 110611]|nr:hypothetical protein SSP35_15_00810 [Streptomyces sp. NBRC 110611]
MVAPARLQRRPAPPLPPPKLVSLIDAPDGPYADSPPGWWDEYGGARDPVSGVVYIPQGNPTPPCRIAGCVRHGTP